MDKQVAREIAPTIERYKLGESYWSSLTIEQRNGLVLPYHHRGMVRAYKAFYQQSVPVRNAVYAILGV